MGQFSSFQDGHWKEGCHPYILKLSNCGGLHTDYCTILHICQAALIDQASS